MALVDARPQSVDVLLRAGNAFTLTLDWPAGSLVGRTFTSTLDGTALAVDVAGDTMTVTVTQAQSAALTGTAVWLLLEDLGGANPEPVLVGMWTPSDGAGATTSQSVNVTVDGLAVTVTVPGQGALDAHEAEDLAHGPEEVGFSESTVTFGPVTATTTGLHGVPVTGDGGTVTVPDTDRPVELRAFGVIRVQTSDATTQTPAGLFVFVLLAPAQAGELLITDALRFAPQYMVPVGNASILERGFEVARRLAPHSPGTYQLFIGCHNNTTPPTFFTPKPVELIVANGNDHGRFGLRAIAE